MQLPQPTRGRMWRQAAAAMGVTGVAAWLLGRSLPLTYDEAYNWNALAAHGIVRSVTTYPVPNNHVLFTTLQALLPRHWVTADPLALRLLNCVYAALLMALMVRWVVRAGTPFWFALIGIIVSSPLLVLYLGVARGYLLATLLTFVSVELLTRRLPRLTVASAVMMALAVWTVPTSAFGMAGIAVVLLAAHRWRDLLLWSGVSLVLTFVLYAPIIHDVLANTKSFGSTPAVGEYSVSVALESLYLFAFGPRLLSGMIFVACVVACAVFAVRRPPPGGPSRIDGLRGSLSVFVLLSAYAVGELAVIEAGNVVGLIHAPYLRSALPVVCAVVVLLFRAVAERDALGRFVALILCANTLTGIAAAMLLATGHDYAVRRYDDVLLTTPPPVLRNAAALGADTVQCARFDGPACILYRPYLARRGVRVELVRTPARAWPCLIGSKHPQPPDQVTLFRAGSVLGVLCESDL